jgi:DNA polymerase-3 subunit delta'
MSQPPVGFAAVRGHERRREFLRAAVAHERLPHALLFVGPEGVGKRSLALALMTWLQCEHGGDDACGRCAACRQMAAGSHLDFQLVTVAPGKKEVGIDRIREVKRFMQLRPVGDKAKVVLIDDAHLLTVAAQNALLKVLEEPPARSFLVLVSNNPDALLATVRSRCQRIHFGPLPIDTVVDILTAGSDMDVATARELAVLAEGSPGRALTLRKCLAGESREQWRQRLAGLDQARYVRLAQTATELNSPESQVAAKLEMLLSQLRDDAVRSLRAEETAPDPSAGTATSLRTILQRADAAEAAWNLIRRGNPNRQLLLEALLLRLAAS